MKHLLGAMVLLLVAMTAVAGVAIQGARAGIPPKQFPIADTIAADDPLRSIEEIGDDYRSFGADLPDPINVRDLLAVTDEATAQNLLKVGRLVYRHYIFSNSPARAPSPPEYAEFFESAVPGACDSASAMVRLLMGEKAGYNFNLIAPRESAPIAEVDGPNYGFWGHTSAEFPVQNGSVLIDPTYGFVLVTTASRFSDEVFRTRNYRQFALVSDVSHYDLQHGLIYPRAGLPTASTARSGEVIQPMFPTIAVDGAIRIGRRDGSSDDLLYTMGGWGDHIGYWYEPTISHWQFSVAQPGRYKAIYRLLAGENVVLQTPLDIGVSVEGARKIGVTYLPDAENPRAIIVTFDAERRATISFRSNSVSARQIDSIKVKATRSL